MKNFHGKVRLLRVQVKYFLETHINKWYFWRFKGSSAYFLSFPDNLYGRKKIRLLSRKRIFTVICWVI